MSTEERNTSVSALHRLEQEGYTGTEVQLGIDDAGLVRESRATVRFADGGAVTTTASFSSFGCREPIVFPDQVDPSASGCSPAAETTSTAATTTTVHLRGNVIAAGTFSGTERFAFEDGRCPELDHDLDAVFTLDNGEQWKYSASYCGTIDDQQVWSGKGTFVFTRPDGSTMSGDFTSTAQLPSPGEPYALHITTPFSGTCEIDNHLVPLSFGVQEQNGSSTCAN